MLETWVSRGEGGWPDGEEQSNHAEKESQGRRLVGLEWGVKTGLISCRLRRWSLFSILGICRRFLQFLGSGMLRC